MRLKTSTLIVSVVAAGWISISTFAQRPRPEPAPALSGTWYVQFRIADTPPGFNLPALLTFHSDGTFEAVDGGDFGVLPDLPFRQTSQHGVWDWKGGTNFLAEGLIFSFGPEGQVVNLLGTEIEIEMARDLDAFTAVVTQDVWICPDTFFCPDPLSDPPDVTIPAEDAGFWIEARRLR